MGERSSYPPGTFSWAELGAGDAAAAKDFYRGLFGWEMQDRPVGESGTYTLCSLRGRSVAALVERSAEARMPPDWLSYITVARVDETARRAAELGGSVAMEPFDAMDAGRIALVQDPAGAFAGLWEPRAHPGAGLVNAPGAMTWNELATGDPDAVTRFYESLVGWRTEQVDGSDGYLVVDNGGRIGGGIRRIAPDEPGGATSRWTVYFAVEDLDAAIAKAKELGGRALREPVAAANGRVASVQDPQGAAFSLFEGELDD